MTFDTLHIPDQLKEQLKKMGFKYPTPVQTHVIPQALLHKDLCVCAKTGSGKTAAFLIPIISHLIQQKNTSSSIKALILCPTRELALQIDKVAQQMTRAIDHIHIEKLIGGQSYQQQYTRLQKPINLLIATPGRLLRHLKQNHLTLATIETVILDEADRILDMGFLQDVYDILSYTPNNRQTCLFSATLSEDIKVFSKPIQNKPKYITIDAPKTTQSHITHGYIEVPQHTHKLDYLISLLTKIPFQQCVIFCNTKQQTEQVSDTLNLSGILSVALHGDMPQKDRKDMLSLIKHQHVNVLVATDLLARGIDVTTISHVINFQLPDSPEDYIHRIGRCGRDGTTGMAISLIEQYDKNALSKINAFLGYDLNHLQL